MGACCGYICGDKEALFVEERSYYRYIGVSCGML
jgi:hypothetical protein